MDQDNLEKLVQRAYEEMFALCKLPRMGAVVENKMTMLYGPPMMRPDLALVSFQGGAEDKSPQLTTWPGQLLYLNDPYRFGRSLRRHFKDAGIYGTLESSTIALAAVFPEASSRDADKWMRQTGAWAEWRKFSSGWVRRLLRAMQPRVIVVFGAKASESLEIDDDWRDEEYADYRGRVFGRGELAGCPAVYCHHLSQGVRKDEVAKCLNEVKLILANQTTVCGSELRD